MRVGELVYVKDKERVGRIVDIDEYDNAVIELKSGKKELVTLPEDGFIEINGKEPHRESGKVVHILGVPYTINVFTDESHRAYRYLDGVCDPTTREIGVKQLEVDEDSVLDLETLQKEVLRHEIVHAFFHESGLWDCAGELKPGESWARSEVITDWIAIQLPKLYEACVEADAI